eukprot:CAMPEP_0175404012 /NCGR_PEP_ID=MMETSP0095-20121207/38323_1 /TAXON_ID=311494 /ORGANISM="Alexandrium monilatum, Strain CCMP3105" /LENGTH=133 /DNA_ID=CAMNT_0016702817 /DNA_START=43 /DNA_END=442 /DNA_ORIENTATION=-
MAMRSTGSLLTLALLAGAAYLLLPTPGHDAFVAPGASPTAQAAGTPSALAQGFQSQARDPRVAAAAQPADNGQPGKINLLFLGLLVGTAAIGLIALFAYGAYWGPEAPSERCCGRRGAREPRAEDRGGGVGSA